MLTLSIDVSIPITITPITIQPIFLFFLFLLPSSPIFLQKHQHKKDSILEVPFGSSAHYSLQYLL